MFLPKQNALIPCWQVLRRRFQATGGTAALPAPTELTTVYPHPVQNHGQTPGDRDNRSTHPPPLGHPNTPRLKPRSFSYRSDDGHRAETADTALRIDPIARFTVRLLLGGRQRDRRSSLWRASCTDFRCTAGAAAHDMAIK
jgi:hypothetical protein